MSIYAIGDIHGEIKTYEGILNRIRKDDPDAYTLQVGDMAVGFKGTPVPQCGDKDFWIAGNHDDALICEKCKGNLGDFGIKMIGEYKLFFLRGAASTDKAWRTEGETWWAYEELTYAQLQEAIVLYQQEKPDLMISHDCPTPMRQCVAPFREGGRTVEALTQMLEIHKPKVWASGHHHQHFQMDVDGCKLMCVATCCYKKMI